MNKVFKKNDLVRITTELCGYKRGEIGIIISKGKLDYWNNCWKMFIKHKNSSWNKQFINQNYFKAVR